MLKNEDYQKLVEGAKDATSRRVVKHLDSKDSVIGYAVGSEDLEKARDAWTKLSANCRQRSAEHEHDLALLAERKAKLRQLQVTSALSGAGQSAEITRLLEEIDDLERRTAAWVDLEPDVQQRISDAKQRVEKFERVEKQSLVTEILRLESIEWLDVVDAWTVVVRKYEALVAKVNQKQAIQAELNLSRDGISYLPTLKIDHGAVAERRVDGLIDQARRGWLK